jgi:hypothetical protein
MRLSMRVAKALLYLACGLGYSTLRRKMPPVHLVPLNVGCQVALVEIERRLHELHTLADQ